MSVPSEEPLVPDEQALDAEYGALRKDMRDLGARVDTARTFGIAAVGAVLTLAIQQHLAVIAIGSLGLAHCFALLDLTNAHRYSLIARRARRVERAIDAYEEYRRRCDPQSLEDLRNRLDSLDKRPFQQMLNEPGAHQMHFTYPRAVFQLLYPALIVTAGVLAIGLQAKRGPDWTIALVVGGVAALWLLCAPPYLDPTKPPLRWWRHGAATSVGARAARTAVAVFAVVAVAIATLLAWGALRNPPLQRPGSLFVQTVPAVRDVAVTLDVLPSCSFPRARLLISWVGRARALSIGLPANLRLADGPRVQNVTVSVYGSSASIDLLGTASRANTGRCTLALPGLVGGGEAQSARTELQDDPRRAFGVHAGVGYLSTGSPVTSCATAAASAPPLTCAVVLHLAESGSASERAVHLIVAALLLLTAMAIGTGWLLAGAR